ncbi:MAG: glycosyltransferase family A protein [Coxiellaceae bacterium]|nr:glycosyltransferase family A protein [Coxiellaceae bacterium]
MATNKKISIVITVWNGENYLSEAIESVINQTYDNIEIIVVNDGSTDNTPNIIQKYSDKIISFSQENKGLGAARNAGAQLAKGEYIAFLDHDDFFERDKLSVQMHAMATQHNDPLIFMHLKQFICNKLTPVEASKVMVNESVLPGKIAGTLLLSKKRFLEIGLFEEKKQLGEFLEWYLRAVLKNIPVLLLNNLGLYRRIHNTNMGRQYQHARVDYLRILKADLDAKRSVGKHLCNFNPWPCNTSKNTYYPDDDQ